MRFIAPVFVFLAVAGFRTALSASLESAEKEEKVSQYDGLTELQKIDQMEFEAAQKNEAAEMNVTEEQNVDTYYIEGVIGESEEEHVDAEDANTAEGGGNSEAAAHVEPESESSEETDGRQRQEHHETVTQTVSKLDDDIQDSTKEQDALE